MGRTASRVAARRPAPSVGGERIGAMRGTSRLDIPSAAADAPSTARHLAPRRSDIALLVTEFTQVDASWSKTSAGPAAVRITPARTGSDAASSRAESRSGSGALIGADRAARENGPSPRNGNRGSVVSLGAPPESSGWPRSSPAVAISRRPRGEAAGDIVWPGSPSTTSSWSSDERAAVPHSRAPRRALGRLDLLCRALDHRVIARPGGSLVVERVGEERHVLQEGGIGVELPSVGPERATAQPSARPARNAAPSEVVS